MRKKNMLLSVCIFFGILFLANRLYSQEQDMDSLLSFNLEESAAELNKPSITPPPELYTLLENYHFPNLVN